MGHKKLFSATGLLLLAVLTLVLVGVFNGVGKAIRIDLTQSKLYTVAEGSKTILESLEKPIDLYLFFSQEQTRDIPALRLYAQRVEDLLNEYELLSGGNVKVHRVNPEPFSEDEDRAAEFGLQAVPISAGGDELYFGLAGENETGDQEVIEFFHPDKEQFLEYELSQLIYRLANPELPVIGIMSNLSIQGGFDMASRQPTPPWMILQQIEASYEVKTVSTTAESIDKDIDILLLIHPKEMMAETQYAVDQFVMRGGKVMLFVDPLAEMDQEGASMMMGGGDVNRGSSLETLMAAWGVEMLPGMVLGDAKNALRVNTGNYGRPEPHVGMLGFRAESFAADSIITDQLETLNVGMAGILKSIEGSQTQFIPLLQSSDFSMPLEEEKFQFLTDPKTLLDGFDPTGEQYVIAAQVTGVVSSAFPDGPPSAEEPIDAADNESDQPSEPALESAGSAVNDEAAEDQDQAAEADAHLATSQGPINIIVVADTDILTDRMWVRVQDFFGRRIAVPMANNSDFLANSLDVLSGSSELITVRSRGDFARPFTLVQELQREAEDRFQRKERELQQSLADTEQKLAELQAAPDDGQSMLTLSPEQEQAILDFEKEKLQIRKDLREVRHQLDKDIDALGTKLKVINIAGVPFALTLVAILFSWRRKRSVIT